MIAGHGFGSRLMVGTGKYDSLETMRDALTASGAEIVTVAVRRLDLSRPGGPTMMDYIPEHFVLLPNTAGATTIGEALRLARLARAAGLAGERNYNFVKLEVIGDQETLLPDVIATVEACRQLVAEGFAVLPYTNDDPVAAIRLVEAGASAVMPMASPIGSGQGFLDLARIELIRRRVPGVPLVVDAGIGAPSDAALAMEAGADAVLVNTAIARAKNPVLMAEAIRLGVQAGRAAYLAGRIPKVGYARPSSPQEGLPR
jgi:thiazole synthase